MTKEQPIRNIKFRVSFHRWVHVRTHDFNLWNWQTFGETMDANSASVFTESEAIEVEKYLEKVLIKATRVLT